MEMNICKQRFEYLINLSAANDTNLFRVWEELKVIKVLKLRFVERVLIIILLNSGRSRWLSRNETKIAERVSNFEYIQPIGILKLRLGTKYSQGML